MNIKVVLLSLLAIGFIVLMFATGEWLWIIGAVIIMLYNQKELMKNSKGKKSEGNSSDGDSGGD